MMKSKVFRFLLLLVTAVIQPILADCAEFHNKEDKSKFNYNIINIITVPATDGSSFAPSGSIPVEGRVDPDAIRGKGARIVCTLISNDSVIMWSEVKKPDHEGFYKFIIPKMGETTRPDIYWICIYITSNSFDPEKKFLGKDDAGGHLPYDIQPVYIGKDPIMKPKVSGKPNWIR